MTAELFSHLAFCLIAVACMMRVAGCSDPAPQGALPTVKTQIGSKAFTLEIANTPAAEEHGLMQRDSMPADHGMIFIFDSAEPRAFWMKNTRIPLDILFLDSAGKVVSIHQMKPYDLSTTESAGPAQYAIELNQGAAQSAGIKPGDTITLPPQARSTAH